MRRLFPLVVVGLALLAAGCIPPVTHTARAGATALPRRDLLDGDEDGRHHLRQRGQRQRRHAVARARHVPPDGRHGHESTRDRVGSRRFVLRRHQGLRPRSSPKPTPSRRRATSTSRSSTASVADARLRIPLRASRDLGRAARRAGRGSVPPRQRGDVWHRRRPHRQRRHFGRRDHRAPSRVQPARPGNERQSRDRRRTSAPRSRCRARSSSGTIDPGEPPGLDFHGTNDALVPYAWATQLSTWPRPPACPST